MTVTYSFYRWLSDNALRTDLLRILDCSSGYNIERQLTLTWLQSSGVSPFLIRQPPKCNPHMISADYYSGSILGPYHGTSIGDSVWILSLISEYLGYSCAQTNECNPSGWVP